MNLSLLMAGIAGSLLLLAVLVFVRKLSAAPKNPIEGPGLDRALAGRYQPMARLLDGDDEAFLAAQPGVSRAAIRRFRKCRRQAFRAYLRGLERDFACISAAIKLLLVASEHDRPDLAAALTKQRILFTVSVFRVELLLVLHACGIGRINAGTLTSAMDAMRLELRQLVPVPTAA